MQRIDLGREAWLDWAPAWLDAASATTAFDQVYAETAWESRSIVVFGKEIPQPRLVGWAGALPYRYSGLTLEPRPAGAALSALWSAVEEATGASFNHAVLNLYRDGADHVAMHSDAERELGRDPLIASVSLGATRTFVMKRKQGRYWKRLRLGAGSLLVMGGSFQHAWRHQVPKEPEVTGARINLTFRRLLGPPGWRPEPVVREASP